MTPQETITVICDNIFPCLVIFTAAVLIFATLSPD